jgi:hypothetical protein
MLAPGNNGWLYSACCWFSSSVQPSAGVALSCLAGMAAAIQAVIEGPSKPWNIKGDLLVLDVSSLTHQGTH